MKYLFLALAALSAAPVAAQPRPAASAQAAEEVRIPFVSFGGIRSFRADRDDEVYIEDRSRNWYRAELYGPCFGLPWALRIGIDPRGSSFDRFSVLLVERERCQIRSLVRSGPPPKKAKKPRRG